MQKRLFERPADCCGCGVCATVCPAGAIELRRDGEGFLYPVVGEGCTDCGACAQVCPFLTAQSRKEAPPAAVYAARLRDETALLASTSGGAFTALSDVVLGEGSVVCGVDFDERFHVVHRLADNPADRDRMRVSKYVQSEFYPLVWELEALLSAGRRVLFTGTPCQTAAVRARLGAGAGAENLLTCDIICHGVPSPGLWESFLALFEREAGGPLSELRFRVKEPEVPWDRSACGRVLLFRAEGSQKTHNDPRFYRYFFGRRTALRPSCGACRFSDIRRASDITIADYWGIEKYAPALYDKNGVSLILVNSARGAALLEAARPALFLSERPIAECLREQRRLSSPLTLPADREAFWADYRTKGLDYVLEHYE